MSKGRKGFILESYRDFLESFVSGVLFEYGEEEVDDYIIEETVAKVFKETSPFVTDTILSSYAIFKEEGVSEGEEEPSYIDAVYDFVDSCLGDWVKEDGLSTDPDVYMKVVNSVGEEIAVLIEASVFTALEDFYDFEYDGLDEAKKDVFKIGKGGKVIKKKVDTIKRPKALSGARKASIRKMVRKAHTPSAQRKRKKTTKIRGRKLTASQKTKSTKAMGKRRGLARRVASSGVTMDVNNIYLAEQGFDLALHDGSVIGVEQGWLMDAYDVGDSIVIDGYDEEGNLVIDDVRVLAKTFGYYLEEELVESVSSDGRKIDDIFLERVEDGLNDEDLVESVVNYTYYED